MIFINVAKKAYIFVFSFFVIAFFPCRGMNERFESLQGLSTEQIRAKAQEVARNYVIQSLQQQEGHDAVHLELMKKIKSLMSDPGILQEWQQVVSALNSLIHSCIQKLALNKNQATELWQLASLEKELLKIQGEEITEQKLAEMQFKLITLVLPLKVAATTVGIPSQEDIALSLAVLIIDMIQRALKKFSPVDWRASEQMPTLGQPIIPEKLQRKIDEED